MFSEEMQFDSETEALFSENLNLESKMNKLKIILIETVQIIESDPKIKVSFGVFDGIKSLAKNDVKKYRGLRVLKEVKSSFVPSFEPQTAKATYNQE